MFPDSGNSWAEAQHPRPSATVEEGLKREWGVGPAEAAAPPVGGNEGRSARGGDDLIIKGSPIHQWSKTMGFGKDGKGVIIRESRGQALGTLAAGTGLFIGTKFVTLERFRMLKAEIYATITGLTSGELTGFIFGLADGQYSLAQVEEAIEESGPLGPNDEISADKADRPVWFTGAIDRETGTEAIFENENGGHMMIIKPRWIFARTKSWNYFVYDLGAAITTGSTVNIRAKSFEDWVT